MAIALASASSQYAEASSCPLGAGTITPFSMAAWFKPASAAAGTIIGLGSGGGHHARMGVDATLHVDAAAGSPSASTATSTATLTNGSWGHAGHVASAANNRIAYANGAAGTANTGSEPVTGLTTCTIGGWVNTGTRQAFLNGSVAELAIWNVALTATDISVLAAGFPAWLVRPSALVWYVPARSTALQEIRNSLTMTLGAGGAAPTNAPDHARIFGVAPWVLTKHAAAGGPSSFSQFATDVLAISESLAAFASLPRSVTDTIAFAESLDRSLGHTVTATDALTITDAVTRGAQALTRPVTDAVGIAESVARTVANPRGVTDALGLADAATRSAALHPRALADTVTVVDNATSNGGGSPTPTLPPQLPVTGAGT